MKFLIQYEGNFEEAVPYRYDLIQIIKNPEKKILDIKKLYIDGTVSGSVMERFKKFIR